MAEIIKLVKDVGLGVGAFGLCAYLTIYIVKRLSTSIDKLVKRIESFTDRVRLEHDQSTKQHERMMNQHEEMIKTLGRINGYRG